MDYKYKHSILGGTFDRFHKGHRVLIAEALSKSEKLTIGIAGEAVYKKKVLSKIIESYNTRLFSVKNFINSINRDQDVKFIKIDDFYGNSLEDLESEAIFVTEENAENAFLINEKRKNVGLKPLEIILVPLVKATDDGYISSERIRLGEIDREGNSYLELFLKRKKFILPEVLRQEFKKPIGKVIKNIKDTRKVIKNKTLVIAVGDIISTNLFKTGIIPEISVIDHKTRRGPIGEEEKNFLKSLKESAEVLRAENQAGMIERRVVGVIRKAMRKYLLTEKKQVIAVDGEEDLLVIPAVLLSPLESLILYGQPDEGFVAVTVTEKKKREILRLFESFN